MAVYAFLSSGLCLAATLPSQSSALLPPSDPLYQRADIHQAARVDARLIPSFGSDYAITQVTNTPRMEFLKGIVNVPAGETLNYEVRYRRSQKDYLLWMWEKHFHQDDSTNLNVVVFHDIVEVKVIDALDDTLQEKSFELDDSDVTGPADATKALLCIYDIFGFYRQTLQGADILSEGDTEQKYQVFLPDFFEGNPAKLEWYPPTTDEQKERLGAWFQNALPPLHTPKVPGLLQAAEKTNSNIGA
ncbi:Uu.00g059250.m01.CDS01 [Anthostomella pinea]|uniref:Uu.00g059250.m01.CDS01 n=1 Tax=Anthostomella pinea TaxID=933095 RepID=A0AAI8YMG6_9PEZI|nr:Uu.00g059250.m01.CDS01 [Anthostomella pinea]